MERQYRVKALDTLDDLKGLRLLMLDAGHPFPRLPNDVVGRNRLKPSLLQIRDYARLPAAQLTALDLNGLVAEVLLLYAPAQEAGRLHAERSGVADHLADDDLHAMQILRHIVATLPPAEAPAWEVAPAVEPAKDPAELTSVVPVDVNTPYEIGRAHV